VKAKGRALAREFVPGARRRSAAGVRYRDQGAARARHRSGGAAAGDRRRRRNGYELLFFNASLSISEKIEKWRAVAKSLQVVTNVLMLSLLAVGVMSMH
jgi:hypothetical protein